MSHTRSSCFRRRLALLLIKDTYLTQDPRVIPPEECVESLHSTEAFVIVNGLLCGPKLYSHLSRTSLDHPVPLILYSNTYNSNAHETLTHVYIKHAIYTCGVEGQHLDGTDPPTGETPTGGPFHFIYIERNTFCASATSCQEVPLSCYISFSSPYAIVAGRMSTSLHALNLSNSFLHFAPLPLGVAEKSDLIAR